VFNLSKSSVHRALAAAGFKRCNAALKPELTPELQAERLAFGRKFEHLTEEEWLNMPILWTDETWATYGNHKMAKVTRRPNERLHPDCVQHRYQRPQGWMFWGSTFGTRKGPGFVWEKEWGNITAANYQVCGKSFRTSIRRCLEVAKDADTSQQHTLPHVLEFIQAEAQAGRLVYFQQDNAPAHKAKSTQEFLRSHDVQVIKWPARSPDLNPIEHCWNWVKDYLQKKYGNEKCTKAQLKERVLEAWQMAVTPERLERLMRGMKKRMAELVAAGGGYIPR
jgi:DDE superfamily endonuclease